MTGPFPVDTSLHLSARPQAMPLNFGMRLGMTALFRATILNDSCLKVTGEALR